MISPGCTPTSDTFKSAHFAQANQRLQHIEHLEDQITELAAHIHAATFRLLELVRNYRMVKRIEALDLENTRHAQRELHWYVDDEGYWVIRGRLTAEQGALIQTVL